MTVEEFGQALVQLGCKVPVGGMRPPRTLVFFGDAPGDDLLCTTVLRELKRRGQTDVWMATRHPELFARNGDIDQLVAPGTDIVLGEAGYLPPTLTDSTRRRRRAPSRTT